MVFTGALRVMTMQCARRIPSIKFRKGSPEERHSVANSSLSKKAFPSHSAPQSTLKELPMRFLRQPLSEEEIECINRGGRA